MSKEDARLREKVVEAFRRLGLSTPYLAGLIDRIDFALDERVETMGVFASGRLIANPAFVASLSPPDLTFVLTHELYHLTLRTHERGGGADPRDFNIAHDYIINDLLCDELQVSQPPAGGLHWPGARHLSAEKLLESIRKEREQFPGSGEQPVWQPAGRDSPGSNPGQGGDVFDRETERALFPQSAADQQAKIDAVRDEASQALALQTLMDSMRGKGNSPGDADERVTALRGMYRPPWELALQRWMEAVAPSDRSYARPSRRGANRSDVVLPGRKREGWMLHIVLDTSGSMMGEIPTALGVIGAFCESMGVEQVRLIQCDTAIANDEIVAPADLTDWRVKGFGGSDLRPAMERLGGENDVRAAVILTDGEIDYPQESVPFDVLWVLPPWAATGRFAPPYGKVVSMN